MNEFWERVLANSFSGIHKSKIICSVDFGRKGVIKYYSVGYNDFNIFDKMEPLKPEMDVKRDSKTYL